jgi:hypothetical protein
MAPGKIYRSPAGNSFLVTDVDSAYVWCEIMLVATGRKDTRLIAIDFFARCAANGELKEITIYPLLKKYYKL